MIRWTSACMFLAVAVGSASADFFGVTCELYYDDDWVANGYPTDELWTVRFYADFSDPGDQLASVYSTADEPLEFYASGPSFTNSTVFDSDTAPVDLTSVDVWENQWDTYVTIGATSAPFDEVDLVPNAAFIQGLEGPFVAEQTGAWTVPPGAAQGFPDADGRVLILQITSPRERVFGRINIGYWDAQDGLVVHENVLIGYPILCFTDLDLNGTTDVNDLLMVIAAWGETGFPVEDVDQDGFVGVSDILLVIAEWGQCIYP